MHTRSAVVLALFIALLTLTGCGAAKQSVKDENGISQSSLSLDELPSVIGRGYPVATKDSNQNSTGRIAPGERAPNFTMTLPDGESLDLADLQGSPVMLNFWATWCPPCRAEMPEIVRAANEDEDLVILAVNILEDDGIVQDFAQKYSMAMPVVMDNTGVVRDLYQIRGMPTSVFINRNGEIESIWTGLLDASRLGQHLDSIR